VLYRCLSCGAELEFDELQGHECGPQFDLADDFDADELGLDPEREYD